ncbi:sigma-70 family RNA polymerase sigma factor [Selenomonas sp.]|uniref:sigma-70 family RNA polymerase sigma factor n=1 Tax=Selenomonas sp. TaxID=2053611 RepID=UPI0025EF9B51|nr:sigma-70 family RNA polymerase sigma factor [Selenomonas sp.]MCI6282974.1 sigma-70 family RNA polymerase sigma factor [Selenomonas sp.]
MPEEKKAGERTKERARAEKRMLSATDAEEGRTTSVAAHLSRAKKFTTSATASSLPLAEERAHIAAAQAGDSAAMMELVTQYEPLLRRAAGQAHLRTIHDDALSESYVSLVRAVRDYDAALGIPFAAFAKARVYGDLRTLARRVIRTWQREATVDDRREEGFWELIEDESAAAALTRYERQATLAAAMRALTERERAVIRLLYFNEATQTAAAAELGVSQQAVAAIKKRAIGKMREAVERG